MCPVRRFFNEIIFFMVSHSKLLEEQNFFSLLDIDILTLASLVFMPRVRSSLG